MSVKLEDFRKKVAKNPENLFFRYTFAQTLSDANLTEEAVRQLEICLERRDDWMMAFFLKAKLEIKLGRNQDAISSLNKTIELAQAQSHENPLNEANELLESLV